MEGMPCPKPSFIRGITTLEFEQKLKSPGFLKHKIEIKAGKVNQIVQIVPPDCPPSPASPQRGGSPATTQPASAIPPPPPPSRTFDPGRPWERCGDPERSPSLPGFI